MKQFFKFLFASCLGTLLAIGAIFMIFMVIGMAMSSGEKKVNKNSVLLVEFDGTIPEKTNNVEQDQFTFEPQEAIGIHRIQKLIEKAQTDDNISGIVYKPSFSVSGGGVKHSMLAEALKTFRDSTDKFVYTYADFFSNNTYLVASGSDSIYINPNGMLDIKGYSAMIPFFKDMLDKVGVKMNVFYAGNFKSATEPFRRMNMSPENRQQTREYLNDNFDLFLKEVCDSRNMNKEDFLSFINTLEFDNIESAIAKGLIDSEAYWYQVEDVIRERMDISEGKAINYIDLQEYSSKTYFKKGSSKNRIAVVYAEGEITYDSDQRGVVSETKYHKIFDKIRKDSKVKAVVLRVNSPGGSAFSSDVIWREMKELQSKGIPVIASFGDYAASGGYYIAAGADAIVSHPKTLTGSIGVFSMLPDFTKLMNDKLGVQFDTIKTHPHAVGITPFYKFDENQETALQTWTDNLYQKFLKRVADGRGKTVDEIHEVAQGRVWTGLRALENGLVDQLGDLDDAIKLASDKAELENDYKVISYPTIKREPWEQLLYDLSKSNTAKLRTPQIEDMVADKVKEMKPLLRYKEPLARLPFVVQN